jgi:hypothetical protein
MYRKSYAILLLRQMIAKCAVEPVQIIGSVYTVDTTGASAIAVETEGCDPSNDIGITNKVGATGVTKAGTACMRIVGQQQ